MGDLGTTAIQPKSCHSITINVIPHFHKLNFYIKLLCTDFNSKLLCLSTGLKMILFSFN